MKTHNNVGRVTAAVTDKKKEVKMPSLDKGKKWDISEQKKTFE